MKRFFENILKQNAIDVAYQLLNYIKTKETGYWLERVTLQIAEQYFKKQKYQLVIELVKPYQDEYAGSVRERIVGWILSLIEENKIDIAVLFINECNKMVQETSFVSIIERLLAKSCLFTAMQCLQFVQTPSAHLPVQAGLKKAYTQTLCTLIGPERATQVCNATTKYTQFLGFLAAGDHAKANHIKDEIILELRGQLDKAFLAFYKIHYGERPIRRGKEVNIYFPVVPETVKRPVYEGLQDYLIYIDASDLNLRFPEFYAYLKHIQPLKNNDYAWLANLYGLANIHKHEHDLPLLPVVSGTAINMGRFLLQAIDGVTELLIKTFNHKIDMDKLKQLHLSHYLLRAEVFALANPSKKRDGKEERKDLPRQGESRDIFLAAPKPPAATANSKGLAPVLVNNKI